jgi:hypothetical protein
LSYAFRLRNVEADRIFISTLQNPVNGLFVSCPPPSDCYCLPQHLYGFRPGATYERVGAYSQEHAAASDDRGVAHDPVRGCGGILLAVSVMLYGKGAVPDAATDPNLKKLFDIGGGLTLMVPFLAAYIGYSIADRAALALRHGAWVGNSFGAGFFGA